MNFLSRAAQSPFSLSLSTKYHVFRNVIYFVFHKKFTLHMNGAPKLNFPYSSPKDYVGDQKTPGCSGVPCKNNS